MPTPTSDPTDRQTPAHWKNTALLVVGHGSTENPDSSAPTHAIVDTLRERGLFSEVHAAFWKEDASMREALAMINADTVYVVPGFISEGYFTQEIIPRELGIPQGETLAKVDGKTLIYSRPVGVHPSMTPLLIKRAREVAEDIDPKDCTLLIVGHGTALNQDSRRVVEQQAEEIRNSDTSFDEVIDTYMEEQPLISDWAEISHNDHVVIVPFFIADGLHSYQDIPVMLGIESEPTEAASQREVFRNNPYKLGNKTLYYSSAIGTDPSMADVILDLVREADAAHTRAETAPHRTPHCNEQFLDDCLTSGSVIIGELVVTSTGEDQFSITHRADAGGERELKRFTQARDARTLSLYDAQGEYRPLRTSPDLEAGWILSLTGKSALLAALDYFYPATVGLARLQQTNALPVVNLRDKLNRQTGMYRSARNITDTQAAQIISDRCDNRCLKSPLWQVSESTPAHHAAGPPPETNAIALLCQEPCNLLVADARTLVKQAAK